METSLTCRSCRSCRWRWRWRCCRCLFIPLFLPLSPFPRFFTRNPKPAEAMACKGTQQERCSISLPFLPSFLHPCILPFPVPPLLCSSSPFSFLILPIFVHSFILLLLSLSLSDWSIQKSHEFNVFRRNSSCRSTDLSRRSCQPIALHWISFSCSKTLPEDNGSFSGKLKLLSNKAKSCVW